MPKRKQSPLRQVDEEVSLSERRGISLSERYRKLVAARTAPISVHAEGESEWAAAY